MSSTTRVLPIDQRASWAQQPTCYDQEEPAPLVLSHPTTPFDRPVMLRLRVQRTSDMERLLAYAEQCNIRIVEVVE